MIYIRLGDLMAPAIAYLVALLLAVFVFGGLLMAGKGIALPLYKYLADRNDGKNRDELFFLLKIAALWCVPLAGFAYAGYAIWTDPYSLTIGSDGTWTLANPYSCDIAALPGHVARSVGVGSHTTTFIRGNGYATSTSFTDFYVSAADGTLWHLSSNDGERVRGELGYGELARLPLETGSDGGFRIMPHAYGPAGPIFAEVTPASAAGAAPPGIGEIIDPAFFRAGGRCFAYWPDDGAWYPARITGGPGREVSVRFDDGAEATRTAGGLRPYAIPDGARVEENLEGKGEYWPATVEGISGEAVTVRYRDGSTAVSTFARIRFRLGS